MAERSNLEKLAVAQALYNAVGAIVSTKSSDNLRAQCDKEAREAGIRSRDVLINGEKVGTYSAVWTKPTPAVEPQFDETVAMHDAQQFDTWICGLDEGGLRELASWIRLHLHADELAEYWLYAMGELPAGCEVVTIEREGKPAQPAQYKNMSLKIDAQAVADALAGELPAVVAGLLQGGEQDA